MAVNRNWDESLAGRHIATHVESYEMARSNFFVFYPSRNMANLPKATYKGELDDISEADKVGVEAINNFRLNITSASVPQFSLGTLTYDRGNETIKFAGKPEWKDGSIAVDDIVGVNTKEICLAWLYAAWNPYTRKGGRAKNYKFDCTLAEYTQDYELIRTWTLYGCWVSEVDDKEFNRASDEKRSLTLTLHYDRAEFSADGRSAEEVPDVING